VKEGGWAWDEIYLHLVFYTSADKLVVGRTFNFQRLMIRHKR